MGGVCALVAVQNCGHLGHLLPFPAMAPMPGVREGAHPQLVFCAFPSRKEEPLPRVNFLFIELLHRAQQEGLWLCKMEGKLGGRKGSSSGCWGEGGPGF